VTVTLQRLRTLIPKILAWLGWLLALLQFLVDHPPPLLT
jgi:hypothetical protein